MTMEFLKVPADVIDLTSKSPYLSDVECYDFLESACFVGDPQQFEDFSDEEVFRDISSPPVEIEKLENGNIAASQFDSIVIDDPKMTQKKFDIVLNWILPSFHTLKRICFSPAFLQQTDIITRFHEAGIVFSKVLVMDIRVGRTYTQGQHDAEIMENGCKEGADEGEQPPSTSPKPTTPASLQADLVPAASLSSALQHVGSVFPSLQKLVLAEVTLAGALPQGVGPSIRYLTLCEVKGLHADQLNEFLNKNCPCLEDLQLVHNRDSNYMSPPFHVQEESLND
mmetsp:Transcript_39719/g.100064  ORF Transcript_39719/g.100064 Transcript_39719/m.100064 type:complete len:282 (-) Transcript_39719:1074-1919(-)